MLPGLGLHHQDFLPKSLSNHEELFFRRYRRDISEAHFRAFWRQALPGRPAMLGPRSTKRCKYRQKLLAVAVAGSRAPCPSGARARDPSHKTMLFTVFCFCVSGLEPGLLFRVGVGNMHNLTNHIIAQNTFLIQKT